MAQSDLEELWDEIQRRGSELVPCDYALHRLSLVEGTVNLAPANVEEKDLELFGDHGLPLETGERNGPINVAVLQGPLALYGASLSAETLARIGDIKAALVDYSGRPEFRKEAEDALIEQYGQDWESCKVAGTYRPAGDRKVTVRLPRRPGHLRCSFSTRSEALSGGL